MSKTSVNVAQLKKAWKDLKKQASVDAAVLAAAKAAYKKAKKRRRAAGDEGDGANKKKKKTAKTAAAQESTVAEPTSSSSPSFDSFAATPFCASMLSAVAKAGFKAPTPIQAKAWPLVLTGGDLVAVAKTGSGKTLAFLLPAFHQLLTSASPAQHKLPSPRALVVAPTRELAIQITAAATQFGAGITAQAVYGGVPVFSMKAALKKNRPAVVVATCGRLVDLLDRRALSLSCCRYVVLDEADRMLDMGFEPQMKKIFAALPAGPERQTLLFSATWPKSIRRLASKFLKKDAQQLFLGDAGNPDAALAANKAVSQLFVEASDDEKNAKLYDILNPLEEARKKAAAAATEGEDNKDDRPYRVVVFANTKNRVDRLTNTFWDWGLGTCAVHGGKRQDERDKALRSFITGECPVMFATDVAARGLDIKGVTHVVNFDMARDVESYVHRIGRTGRAGELGASITFWNRDFDKPTAPALIKIARQANQEVPAWLTKYERVKTSKQWRTAKAVLC